jgi:hypothetical protein
MDSTDHHYSAGGQKSPQRSRIANGSAMLLGAKDERSVFVRRLKEIVEEYINDIGPAQDMTSAEKSIVRRIAVLTIQLEKLETRFAEDPSVGERTLDLYNRTAGNLGRLLERLGIRRKERKQLDLSSYLAGDP